jgi:hypothetical protein
MVANVVRESGANERRGDWLAEAERMAVEQMNFLYSEAIEAWRASQKLTPAAGRSSCGEPRYLAAAMRINVASLEMQTRHRTHLRLMQAKLAKLEQQIERVARKSPPARDYSPFRGDRQESRRKAESSPAVSNHHKAGYDDTQADVRVPLTTQNGSSDTVHAAQPAVVEPACLTTDEPAKRELFPKLNRQERRARQRQLEKIRKRRPR